MNSTAHALVLKPLLDVVLQSYSLSWTGIHGLAHWARVLENGLRLAEETGADAQVVAYFAILHDSRRMNDHFDPDHGPRAAEFAMSLQGQGMELDDQRLTLLFQACEGHTRERTHSDVTIQTCWDADRLDLGRVGTQPHPEYLSTAAAKRPDILNWAHGRACFGVVPEFVDPLWAPDHFRMEP